MHSLVRVSPGSGAHPTQRDLRLQEQTLVCSHHKPNCQGRRVSAVRVLLKAFHARQTPAQSTQDLHNGNGTQQKVQVVHARSVLPHELHTEPGASTSYRCHTALSSAGQ